MKHVKNGFTVVELLIVIVVIAILAAISIVAYNGIQQRANNNAIINAVSQSIKVINAYYAQESAYPLTSSYACVTTTSGCTENNGTVRGASAILDTNIAKVATLPRNIPSTGSVGNGIIYNHAADRKYNSEPRPVLLMYFLNGQNQNCGVSNVMSAWGTTGQDAFTSSTGYTANNASANKTVCFVSV